MSQGSLSISFFPWDKILLRVRLSFHLFLSAMHNTDPRSTYHNSVLFLSPSNKQIRCLCRRWLSLLHLWENSKVLLWLLSPSFLPFCPESWSRYNISSFFPQAWQSMLYFSLAPTPPCPLPNARTLCGCIRFYPVSVCFSPSWTFRRYLNVFSSFLSCAGFSGWNVNIFRLSNGRLSWTKVFSSRTEYWLSVRATMFGTTFRLCNPTPPVSRTSRGGGNCCASCFSSAPYTDSIWGYLWKRYSSVSVLEIPNWHFCPKALRFLYNFFLWRSILVDNSALLW